jgi:myo-inositol 2-dehydrogenase/D-chiro-inositol 1-dehydrogenase
MSPALRIGIVGLGRLGKRHAENLALRVPGAVLVAAASPVAAERTWAEQNLPSISNSLTTYDDLPGLLRHPGLDAVWLVTPTSLHAGQTVLALEAGKHVFCEKPLALETRDCDAVIEAARSRPGQVAMVGFMRRFDPAYAEARRQLREGALGELFHIHCASHDPIDPHGFFVKFAPTSGGIFLDCCIHDLDLVRWMLDGARPLQVSAAGTRRMYPALEACGDIDTGFATITFEGGAVATFHVSRTSHRGYEATMSLNGTRGALSLGRDLTRLPLVTERDGQRCLEGQPDFFARFNDAFLLEARAFVAAVREGLPSPLSLEDAREATRLACALRDALVQPGALPGQA